MKISGPALKVGDDVNTDVMYPGSYLTLTDWREQAKHIFEGLGPEWPVRVSRHKVLVAGWNIGCGSSREQAATALLGAGIGVVVAKSFARLFLRNCINNGLPVVESAALADACADGETLTVDVAAGSATLGQQLYSFAPLPPELLAIVSGGGLLARLKAASRGGIDGTDAR